MHYHGPTNLLSIGKIFVYKNCFCYLNVQNVKQKNFLFYRDAVGRVALDKTIYIPAVYIAYHASLFFLLIEAR